MLKNGAPIWGAANAKIKGGFGHCVVYASQAETEIINEKEK